MIQDTNETQKTTQEPVNRARRANFCRALVIMSLLIVVIFTSLAGLGIFTANIPLVTAAVDGFINIAIFTTLAYVSGSTLDYNGGLANILGRR